MTANDNLGILMAGVFRPLSTGDKSVGGLKATDGSTHAMKIYGNPSLLNMYNEISTSQAQVGKGTAIPTRQDIDIENKFTNGGVEDNKINSNTFGYNSGLRKILIATQINPTNGIGQISEVCKFHTFLSETTGTAKVFLMYRNLINPPVGFIVGQSIDLEHEVLI